jgi:SAM-dependent methyltransferase
MFDGHYFQWNSKRIKGIIEFYGYKFFYFKRLLDLGCGHGDLGGVLYRLGANVTCVDARQEHLKVVNKKYNGIKTVQTNLDAMWPFHGQKFDVILDLGLLCHLSDFETHLKTVCNATTHLILETAVCDSDDPQKVVLIDEDRDYDLSYNGKGCRPSPAAVERVLRECGMNIKRLDNSKFNAGDYVYDWYPKNDNSTNLSKRRIWFAVKESSPLQFANPASELATPPIIIPSAPSGPITPIQNSGIAVTASPKPPMSSRMEAEARAKANFVSIAPPVPEPTKPGSHSGPYTAPEPSPIRTYQKIPTLNDKIRRDSKEFSLIEVDNFVPPAISQLGGVISPNTFSSRMWYKKICPLFPNLRLAKNVISMPGFAKSDKIVDVVMCSLDNLQPYKKVWIDEWFGPGLSTEHVNVLKRCTSIITPSLINAQEIWKHIPHAAITRVAKPWPLLSVPPAEGKYYLYFEKSTQLTPLLFEAWDPQFGNLVVVGASTKAPSFVTFISDTESYVQIMKLIIGAQAILDISENNYYASGINKLATAIGVPLITNNHIKLVPNNTLIQQDKEVSIYPRKADIHQAIQKFIDSKPPRTASTENYNNSVIDNFKKIMGL